jgi:hypothetical protein
MTDEIEEEPCTNAKMLNMLKRHGVIKLTVEFNGGGDSGDIGEIDCDGIVDITGVELTEADRALLELPEQVTTHVWDANARRNTQVIRAWMLYDAVHQWASDLLDNVPFDWCNNEGGLGTLIVIPGDNFIFVDGHARVTSTEPEPNDYSLPENDEQRERHEELRQQYQGCTF